MDFEGRPQGRFSYEPSANIDFWIDFGVEFYPEININ